MNPYKTILLSILLLPVFLLKQPGLAQQLEPAGQTVVQAVADLMLEEGFQSIEAFTRDKKIVVRYENRVYRFEATAIKRIIQLLHPVVTANYEMLVLIPKQRNIPMVSIELDLKRYESFANGEISARELFQNTLITDEVNYYKITPKPTIENNGNFKLEFEFEPQLRLSLGGFPDAVIHQVNLLPTANIFLWQGAQLKFQGILPLLNEFEIPEEEIFRPGIMAFTQFVRLPQEIFALFSAGYYTENRYGLNLEVAKYFLNNNLQIKARAGFTGYAAYPQRRGVESIIKGWEYANPDYWDYEAGVAYRFPKWDLNIGAEAGKGLLFKEFVRVNVFRQFDETQLGFFALVTNDGENYGFNLSVPLFPKKYWKPKVVSVRPSRSFRYTYHATQNYITQYETGIDIATLYLNFNPAFLRNQLSNGKDWN